MENATAPIFFQFGERDGWVSPEAQEEYAAVAGEDDTFVVYEGQGHELLGEVVREERWAWLETLFAV